VANMFKKIKNIYINKIYINKSVSYYNKVM